MTQTEWRRRQRIAAFYIAKMRAILAAKAPPKQRPFFLQHPLNW